MFDIGFWELGLIAVIALVILGPERLPRAARTAGLWLGRARRMMAEVKADIKREVDAQELADMKKIGDELKQTGSSLKETTDSLNEVIGAEPKSSGPAASGATPSAGAAAPAAKQPDEPATSS